jgi:serine/arginine repetitive matrix protein 1
MVHKGTSTEQDPRFGDKEQKLLKTMQFPASFSKKVDFSKVNLAVLRPWIEQRIEELLGFEDEVVVDFCWGMLEEEVSSGVFRACFM